MFYRGHESMRAFQILWTSEMGRGRFDALLSPWNYA